jgi:hypothetical protein
MNYPRLPAVVTPRAKAGLGDLFYGEILDAVVYLEENYNVPPFDKGNKDVKRHVNRGDFPWLIYYKILSDHLAVAAFSHPKEKPTRNRA